MDWFLRLANNNTYKVLQKCPESRNSATGVDYESWPQLQGAKPLRRKSRKPDQVDIARYSKEQIDAAIDAAVQAFGLESLKHQQQKAIEEFVSGRDVFVALPAVLFRSSAYSFRPSACRQRAFDYGVCVHLPSWWWKQKRSRTCTQMQVHQTNSCESWRMDNLCTSS